MTTRISPLCLFAVPLLLSVTACNRSANTTRTTEPAADEAARSRATATEKVAYVRFVNGYPGKKDLYFGAEKLFTEGSNDVGQYKAVPAERHDFELRDDAHMTGEPLAKNSEGLSAGSYYTVAAYAEKGNKAELKVVNDDEGAPGPGKVKVRIVHAAPGLDAVNLYATGTREKLASESRFTTSSMWQEIDPVKGPIEVRTTNKKDRPVRLSGVSLEPGELLTVVVFGGQKSGEALTVTPIVDNPKDRNRG